MGAYEICQRRYEDVEDEDYGICDECGDSTEGEKICNSCEEELYTCRDCCVVGDINLSDTSFLCEECL